MSHLIQNHEDKPLSGHETKDATINQSDSTHLNGNYENKGFEEINLN